MSVDVALIKGPLPGLENPEPATSRVGRPPVVSTPAVARKRPPSRADQTGCDACLRPKSGSRRSERLAAAVRSGRRVPRPTSGTRRVSRTVALASRMSCNHYGQIERGTCSAGDAEGAELNRSRDRPRAGLRSTRTLAAVRDAGQSKTTPGLSLAWSRPTTLASGLEVALPQWPDYPERRAWDAMLFGHGERDRRWSSRCGSATCRRCGGGMSSSGGTTRRAFPPADRRHAPQPAGAAPSSRSCSQTFRGYGPAGAGRRSKRDGIHRAGLLLV